MDRPDVPLSPRATTVDLLRRAAASWPDVDAYVDGEHRLTFAAWERASGGVASLLAEQGVGRGDVVALLLPSSIDYAVCYLAAMRLGAITSGINPRLGPREIATIVDRTRPVVTVLDDGTPAPTGSGRAIARADLEAAARRPPPDVDPSPGFDDPVAIVWTSGTTGLPKGAWFTHANLAAVAAGAGDLTRVGDRKLSPLPFAHVGYMARVWDDLANHVTTVLTPTPWKADATLALLARERITVAQGVPAQWALVLRHPDLAGTDVSSLRLATTGGAQVAPEQVRRMVEVLGCPVVVRYASTETALATGTRPEDDAEVTARTVGRPLPGVELDLADVEDGVGTIRIRSGAVMQGYWGDPERTAEARSPDGWITTGDLATIDADGNVTIVGRRTDLYIRGGYNVYPAEVEAVLAEHPAVAAVAVVGAPDDVLGEVGVAFVVAATTSAADGPGSSEASRPTLEALRAWSRARLADYKAPDRIHLVPELPLTAMSKVDKRRLQADLAARGPEPT